MCFKMSKAPKIITDNIKYIGDQKINNDYNSWLNTSYYNINDIRNNLIPNISKINEIKHDNNKIEEKKTEGKNNNDLSETESKNMFEILAKINWKDKDEQVIYDRCFDHLKLSDLLFIKNNMQIIANKLYDILDKFSSFNSRPTGQKKDILFHIIAKMRELYVCVIDDPEFGLYTIDQYQPFYTYLERSIAGKSFNS